MNSESIIMFVFVGIIVISTPIIIYFADKENRR